MTYREITAHIEAMPVDTSTEVLCLTVVKVASDFIVIQAVTGPLYFPTAALAADYLMGAA